MDAETLKAYNEHATIYAKEWLDQDEPVDMYELLLRFFKKGRTVDIGCGAGRDVAWLAKSGFDVCGFDASDKLIEEAKTSWPDLRFGRTTLPSLQGVEKGAFDNVLCETVIMHLPTDQIGEAIRNLLDLVCPGGVVYLSWRVTERESQRDKGGRLYSAFDRQIVLDAIDGRAAVMFEQDVISASSRKRIQRLIVQAAN